MLNEFTYSLPSALETDLRQHIEEWDVKTARIWQKDATIWTGDDEAKWLGWLDIVERELSDVQKYADLQRDIAEAGFTDILLMGMGGSSLCPEVLAITFGKTNFHILDSTVPAQVRAVEQALPLKTTLFIVASKSGSTLEPNCFYQYFFDLVSRSAGAENAGRHFLAITDPGSKMERVAKDNAFRHIFYGDPEVGGRFSALSVFGMTAAAAMGVNVTAFLSSASSMVEACRKDAPEQNPGAALGLILGACRAAGRDKLTIFTSPEIYDLGAWLEQLIAESTGKNGVAIIPVDREPIQLVDKYGDDRVFVVLTVGNDEGFVETVRELTAAGHPVIEIGLDTVDSLGQEFFRWEFATAVAGSVMGINPFNQPDVESAKIEARKITEEYEQRGRLPEETAFFTADGVSLFTSEEYAERLTSGLTEVALGSILAAHFDQIRPSGYFAVLAYVEMSAENEQLLQELREHVLHATKAATCLGFGPRFLHSTGQAYKGGANNGVFLQITSDDEVDVAVPGQEYTFGVVKAAQARGDFQVLLDRERRALRVHLGSDVAAGLRHLNNVI